MDLTSSFGIPVFCAGARPTQRVPCAACRSSCHRRHPPADRDDSCADGLRREHRRVRHEMMLVSVAGTPQIACARRRSSAVVKSINGIFGTSGSNVMRVIDDTASIRATQSNGRFSSGDRRRMRPTENVNPPTAHVTEHLSSRAGRCAVRLNMPTGTQTFAAKSDRLPVSLMIGRDTAARTVSRRTDCSKSCSGWHRHQQGTGKRDT